MYEYTFPVAIAHYYVCHKHLQLNGQALLLITCYVNKGIFSQDKVLCFRYLTEATDASLEFMIWNYSQT